MDKCVYNDMILLAEDVEHNEAFEKEVRRWGNDGQLKCYGDDCHLPVIYKVNKKKGATFAHKKNNVKCAYEEFSRNKEKYTTYGVISFRKSLFHYLAEKYPDNQVAIDYKVFPNQWSDMTILENDKKLISIEILDEMISPSIYNSIQLAYNQNREKVIWIILSPDNDIGREGEVKWPLLESGQLLIWNTKDKIFNYYHKEEYTEGIFSMDAKLHEFDPLNEKLFLKLIREEPIVEEKNDKVVNKDMYPLSTEVIIDYLTQYFNGHNKLKVEQYLKMGYLNDTQTKTNFLNVYQMAQQKKLPFSAFAMKYQFNWFN